MRWPGITPFCRVCLRFDDYHQSVGYERWVEVLSEYAERGLRGVVGVVPNYHGDRLSAEVIPLLDDLVESGWEVAQHGYKHLDVGEGRGGLLYDDRSEFCGLNYAEQERRIGAGKDILKSHGFEPTTFIPPWHEYDRTTLRALSDHDFDCLNEGRLPFPQTVDGVTLVPTHPPGLTPAMFGVGIVTLVRHPHLDNDPYKAARTVENSATQVRVPSEIVDWWTD